jgi:hypothetical protein
LVCIIGGIISSICALIIIVAIIVIIGVIIIGGAVIVGTTGSIASIG